MPRTVAPLPASPRPTPLPASPLPTPRPAAPQLVLAFDFGRRRIGVACGDTLSRTATPLAALANAPSGPHWGVIESLLREWRPALIVLGLPYHVDGSESGMSRAARGFGEALERRYGLPVRTVDERYSSLEAESRLKSARASGLRKRRLSKSDVDATAASVILERWFNESP